MFIFAVNLKSSKMDSKKYRVTDKHPGLKEGVTFSEILSDQIGNFRTMYADCKKNISIGTIASGVFNAWIDSGWVEEIQIPEWTDKDMIAFSKFCYDTNRHFVAINGYEKALDAWINE